MPIQQYIGSWIKMSRRYVVLDWIIFEHPLRLIKSILLDGDGFDGPRLAAVGGSHSAGLKK